MSSLDNEPVSMAFTSFFRDAQTLEVVIDQALPNIRGQAFIDVWDAGCAHGPHCWTSQQWHPAV